LSPYGTTGTMLFPPIAWPGQGRSQPLARPSSSGNRPNALYAEQMFVHVKEA
jgi:hypothetical protein